MQPTSTFHNLPNADGTKKQSGSGGGAGIGPIKITKPKNNIDAGSRLPLNIINRPLSSSSVQS